VSNQWLRYLWMVPVAIPSSSLLIASSDQFRAFSPLPVSPLSWYAAMVLTGVYIYATENQLTGLLRAVTVVVFTNVAAHIGACFVATWAVSDYDMAILMIQTLMRPAVLHLAIGGLFVISGIMFTFFFVAKA